MELKRRSGILLHPTSLPGAPGIGTLGKAAYHFVDWLASARQTLWQILPLGPTGYGDSPYASFSTFAGNPLMIDLDALAERGWADPEDIAAPDYIRDSGPVDFGSVVRWKMPLLEKCAAYFQSHCGGEDRAAYESFKNDSAAWLDRYADFTSIKQHYDAEAERRGVSGVRQMWNAFWPADLAACDAGAVAEWNAAHSQNIEEIKTIQFFFETQWLSLRKYANGKGVSIIGDIPIFVAPDSADVWANQRLFQIDRKGVPLKVAGVPPDYFSATGQLWGNPLYDWDAMRRDGYSWWIRRIARTLSLVDCVRIDHFRGFEAYWSVPYGAPTAETGRWVPGPNTALFDAIRNALGDIPVIAEDLGVITDGVRKLRDDCGFPGMKILQFAFDPAEAGKDGMVNTFLPHMYTRNCVAYTGTHDNDTMQGWLDSASDEAVRIAAEYALGAETDAAEARRLSDSGKLREALVRAAIASVAAYAVIPMQDIIGLGSAGRMNTPSTVSGGNWSWRMREGDLTEAAAGRLAFLGGLYGRNVRAGG